MPAPRPRARIGSWLTSRRLDTRWRTCRLLLVSGLLALAFAAPAPAVAEGLFLPRAPESTTVPPRGYRLSAESAVRIARRESKVRRESERPGPPVIARAFLFGNQDWLVRFFRAGGERVQVQVDGRSGKVGWASAGRELDWPPLVHGEHSAAARRLHWLMLLAAVLFVAPFIDPRRPLRLLNFDLLA